jgi:hypothetical protein
VDLVRDRRSSALTHHRAAYHDGMEMGNYEICIMNVNIDRQGGQEQARQTAHRKETDKPSA